MADSGGCCPASAWTQLKPDPDYVEKGAVVKSVGGSDLDVYRVGDPDAEKCIVWCYDIFGFNSGRTRQLADALADRAGALVIVPDYYRGQMQDPSEGMDKVVTFIKAKTDWPAMKREFETLLKPLQAPKAKVFGAIGTCWGTYPVLKYCAEWPQLFTVGVNMHPSHPIIINGVLKEDEKAVLEAAKGTKQLFMPAGEDADSVKAGGLADQVLGENAKFVAFPDMSHGWTTRGDISDAKVEAAVKRAMTEAGDFFNRHLNVGSNL